MKLNPNEFIKIKDENHLKRLCEENGLDFSEHKLQFFNHGIYHSLVNNDDTVFFRTDTIQSLKLMLYTEVFEEETNYVEVIGDFPKPKIIGTTTTASTNYQEKKMRYFIVSFNIYYTDGTMGSGEYNFISESYVNRKSIDRLFPNSGINVKRITITNILELTQQDYEDFIA